MTNLHYPEEAADFELVQATSYIASKISDMNRPSKAKKGKENSMKVIVKNKKSSSEAVVNFSRKGMYNFEL
jgi:hypothetical protein